MEWWQDAVIDIDIMREHVDYRDAPAQCLILHACAVVRPSFLRVLTAPAAKGRIRRIVA
jgi:hypothetical protein